MNLRRGLIGDELIQELEDKVQSRAHRKFTNMPDIKNLHDREVVSVEESGTYKLVIRIGNELYKTGDLTKVV